MNHLSDKLARFRSAGTDLWREFLRLPLRKQYERMAMEAVAEMEKKYPALTPELDAAESRIRAVIVAQNSNVGYDLGHVDGPKAEVREEVMPSAGPVPDTKTLDPPPVAAVSGQADEATEWHLVAEVDGPTAVERVAVAEPSLNPVPQETPMTSFKSILSDVGNGIKKFFATAAPIAQEAEPIVDLATAAFPGVPALYNATVNAIARAETIAIAAGQQNGTSNQKLALAASEILPVFMQYAAAQGLPTPTVTTVEAWINACVAGLNAIPAATV